MDEKGHALRTGARVMYMRRHRDHATSLPAATGTVAGRPVFDRYTMETWIPVQPDGTSTDTEPTLIRRSNIVDLIP